MLYFLCKMKTKMAKIAIEDIFFWIMVIATTGVIFWKLHGSPTDMVTIIGIGTFILISEIAVWKKIFSIEKNTTMGFTRVKSSFQNVKHDMEKNQVEITNKLNLMENNIKNKLDKLIKGK